MFKGLGNLASMMKQAQQVGAKMQEITAQLKQERVVGSTGGGMVEVEANGAGEILRVSIESSLMEREDREMLEDLIPAAVNQALAKARELHANAMREVTGGLDIPGLNEAMENLTEGGPTP